jgi:hypothetical protein
MAQKYSKDRETLRKNTTIEHIKQEAFANSLLKNGHTCVKMIETFPLTIQWCKQEPCSSKNPPIK